LISLPQSVQRLLDNPLLTAILNQWHRPG